MTHRERFHRRAAIFALVLLPLLFACNGDDGNRKVDDTPTATATVQPTATSTTAPSSTNTTAPTATPTAESTSTSTATPTATETSTPTATTTPTPFPPDFRDLSNALPAGFVARGSVGQVYVLDAEPGTELELVGDDGFVVTSGTADEQGAFLFRDVAIGSGYAVVAGTTGGLVASDRLEVKAADDPPDPSFYAAQEVVSGYGYIETRDGTLLAINVLLPGPIDGGPYPTVIEYSGYDPANPDSPQPSTLISAVLGYAAVGLNMRGTGCSGGAFEFFETLQSTDGYDAVEIIAAQPWVKNHKVGMVGLSYPGISQLFVARTQPPHLASIAPLSVIADTGRGTLYPGGILNNGFAVDWAAERQHDASPFGQAWSRRRRDAGDEICIANQKLRLQSPDIMQMIRDNPFYYPEIADPLSPVTFVGEIEVPVFLAGAWQDEQTGPYFATMLDRFTGTDKVHFTMVNGGHTEPFSPTIFSRWVEFLSFYVRREIPAFSDRDRLILGVLASDVFDVDSLSADPDRFADVTTFDEALARFEGDPPVRVLFENGAGAEPGAPYDSFEASFDAWPIPELEPTAWYFAEDGRLDPAPPSGDGADGFVYDPSRSQITTCEGCGSSVWHAVVPWDWKQPADGTIVSYATEPLEEAVVTAGSGSVDLFLQSTAPDVDVQVTLSEIRPDGEEVYVQSGWLRASHRKLDAVRSTELRPVQTHREEDAAPLPEGELSELRVEIFPFAHVFRAGSRIRVIVGSPGGDRQLWQFEVLPADGEVINTVGRSAAAPSRVVLPVVPGIEVDTPLPPCPGLRAQPCRTYVETTNTPG